MSIIWQDEAHHYQERIDGEICYVIDINQFNLAPSELPEGIEWRHETEQEARRIALLAANLTGDFVEVEMVHYYGYYGRMVLDSFIVEPEGK